MSHLRIDKAGVPILPMYTTNINTAYSTLRLTRSKKWYLFSHETKLSKAVYLFAQASITQSRILLNLSILKFDLLRPLSQFVYSTTRLVIICSASLSHKLLYQNCIGPSLWRLANSASDQVGTSACTPKRPKNALTRTWPKQQRKWKLNCGVVTCTFRQY